MGIVLIGFDPPFFSSIVLFQTGRLPLISRGFLEKRIPGTNGEGTPHASAWGLQRVLYLQALCDLGDVNGSRVGVLDSGEVMFGFGWV